MSHDDIAAAGGPSSPTLTKIASGAGTISMKSAKKLEEALGWDEGDVRRFATGERQAKDLAFDKLVVEGETANELGDVERAIEVIIEMLHHARRSPVGSARESFLVTAGIVLHRIYEVLGTRLSAYFPDEFGAKIYDFEQHLGLPDLRDIPDAAMNENPGGTPPGQSEESTT